MKVVIVLLLVLSLVGCRAPKGASIAEILEPDINEIEERVD